MATISVMPRDDCPFSEFLIDQVRGYECLYNPMNASYKIKRNKNMCWVKIGQECHLDAIDVKNKWKNLRDRYVRERKAEKIAEQTGTLASRKEWSLYRKFAFLDPFLVSAEVCGEDPKQGRSVVKSEHHSEPQSEDSSTVTDDDSIGHFLDIHSYSKPVHHSPSFAPPAAARVVKPPPNPPQPFVYILPAPASNPPPPQVISATPSAQVAPVAKRAKMSNADKPAKSMNSTQIERRFMKYMKQHGSAESEEYTSDEMFVLSLVPSFNKLTDARKDKLKLDMHKLVYEAVYGLNT